MNAGRELDALVAEKVMGWKRREVAKSISEATVLILTPVPTDWFWVEPSGAIHHPSDSVGGWGPPRYSTDIAAAWEVVEKMGLLNDRCLAFNEHSGQWQVWSMTRRIGGSIAGIEAETAPLAICLAALKAKGVEVEDDVTQERGQITEDPTTS